MKKILLYLLTAIMLSIVLMGSVQAEVAPDFAWELSDDGTLTISGHGEMPDYNYDSSPWSSKRDSIKKVVIQNGLTSIGNHAFYRCTSLTGITIPNGVTSIEWGAFSGCTSLTSITIPNSVTSIGSDAFYDTPWYDSMPDGVVYINRVLYDYKRKMPADTHITIEPGTISISGYAFSGCTGLTNITIPDSVTSIGEWAFGDCTSLTSITIPNSVTSIGTGAFYGCTTLTDVYYTGTEGEWKSITIGSYNNDTLLNATIHFNNITVLLNSVPVSFPDQQPLIKDSRTLVPARGVFEALGATVGWDDAMTVERGETRVTLTIGESYISVNGERKEQDVPAQIVNSRTMIPVRAVAEAFSCTVGWDGDTYTVSING